MKDRNTKDGILAIGLFFLLISGVRTSAEDWPQWGGPYRNFTAPAAPLAESWPPDGPPKLWERELGVGYSGVVVADGKVYTMYRDSITAPVEYTVALDARTGATLWRHENPAPVPGPPAEPPDTRWGGQGPNATPMVVGDRLYTVGSRALLHCFDRHTGKILWKKDLAEKYGACMREGENSNGGFCASPIAYRDTLIIPTGGRADGASDGGRSMIALDLETGDLRWKSLRFGIGAASPFIAKVHGCDQVLLPVKNDFIGVDPTSGGQIWNFPLPENAWPIPSAVWTAGNQVLIRDRNITRMLSLSPEGEKTVVREAWSSRKLRFAIATAVPMGDYVYGASDHMLIAAHIKTGKRAWVKRGYPSASVVAAGDKLIVLDENGQLTLATPTPDDLIVHGKAQVTERYSLTAPAIVDTTLFIRDRKKIVALDLSKS